MGSLRCFILAFIVIQLTTGEERTSCEKFSTYPFKCYISWPPPKDGALEICGKMIGSKRRLHIFLEASNTTNIPLKVEFIKNDGQVKASSREGAYTTQWEGDRNFANFETEDFPIDFDIKNVPFFCVLLTEEDNNFIVRLRYNNSTHKVMEYKDQELGVPSILKITKQFEISFAGMTE